MVQIDDPRMDIQKMIELRWYQKNGRKTTTKAPVLQFRVWQVVAWSEWRDVPLEFAPDSAAASMVQP